jgi:hypothetical protein
LIAVLSDVPVVGDDVDNVDDGDDVVLLFDERSDMLIARSIVAAVSLVAPGTASRLQRG